MMSKFAVGDRVTWVRAGLNGAIVKTGFVEAIIPPLVELTAEQKKAADAYGRPRSQTSYLVRVPTKTGSGAGKLHWPPEYSLAKAASDAGGGAGELSRPEDSVSRSVRIMALVDAYTEKPSQDTFATLRDALLDEFEAARAQGRGDQAGKTKAGSSR